MTKTLVGTPDPEPRRPGAARAPYASFRSYNSSSGTFTEYYSVNHDGTTTVTEWAFTDARPGTVTTTRSIADPDICVYCLHPIGKHDNDVPGCTVCGCTRVVFEP